MSWEKVFRKNSLVTRTMAVVVAMAMAFTMCFVTPIISYAEDGIHHHKSR